MAYPRVTISEEKLTTVRLFRIVPVGMILKFDVSRDGEYFVASWNAPMSTGGITTQAKTLKELEKAITEAVRCHFDGEEMPQKAVLHFTKNPEVRFREAA